jgi:hypothetical protein
MTEQHPITPPPELVQQWWAEETYDPFGVAVSNLANRAAQWGADQELEACREWLKYEAYMRAALDIRAARRPKPPSLKEQALEALERYTSGKTVLIETSIDTIRRALEALPDDSP